MHIGGNHVDWRHLPPAKTSTQPSPLQGDVPLKYLLLPATSSPPRVRHSSTFPALDPAKKIEEQRMPAYDRGLYYPVKLGDVFCSRYQVLSKLGFEANSMIWFCRDLQQHRYIALKIYIHSSKPNHEVQVLEYLVACRTDHPDHWAEREPPICVVQEPLLSSLLHFQATLNPMSLTEALLKGALQQLLLALDIFIPRPTLSTLVTKNIIIESSDPSIFDEWEKEEEAEPTPRKTDNDMVICQSRRSHRKKGWNKYFGMPILCDLGEARIGDVHTGVIQPDLYRAPEVVLGMEWTSKVDIWNVGVLIWDIFEDDHLFDGRGPDEKHSDAQLLAEMMSILGPPSTNFLNKSSRSGEFWNEQGRAPSFSSSWYLSNEEMFMQFMKKMLRWAPEERQSAQELLMDPWLMTPC
ncbi:kinase-like domain-containing protein [Aspergillus minisclerotigenes]|uniref:Kinase-like domain-containing protein n=1 Tax=Aspergillus minisclerotigenes TaxID=656917 RepID=A0A5N6JD89_9EURO|nr:kinase-like domain-containing protein [Aspergillus minisclerotigenes]